MNQRFQSFVTGITVCYKYIQRIKSMEMTELGLKGTHVMCLFFLHQNPEGLTAAKLCQLCAEDKAAISRMMAELEEKGMVSRGDEKGNRYRMQLRLTSLGEEAADHVEQRAKLAVEEAGSGMTEEQRATLYAVLDLIAGNLQTICAEGLR